MMRKLLRNDEGFVLFVVLGAIAVITAVAFGGFLLAQQSVAESRRVQTESKAFQVAASGLDRELATFSTANFNGNASYTKTGTTPDGQYTIYVGTTGVPFMYTIDSQGRSQNTSETVRETFFYMDLWDVNIGAGTNGDFPNPFGSGGSLNGNCYLWGPMYVRGDVDMNSQIELHNGPLFARDGFVHIWANTQCFADSGTYSVFASEGADISQSGPAQTKVYTKVPEIDLPWVDDFYLDTSFELAKLQSQDNLMGREDRSIANVEVGTVNVPTSYTGAKAPGASDYYKVVGNSSGHAAMRAGTYNLTIDATSFGKYPGNGYDVGSAEHDDFAFDATNGILYVEGTVFVDGDLTLGTNVRKYVGNGTIVANGDVVIHMNQELRPLSGTDGANNLSGSNCLGLSAAGGVTLDGNGSAFEGVIFANQNFQLLGNWTEMRGTIHANGIDPQHPNQTIKTEPATVTWLPESMPGGPTDPRGAGYAGTGIIAKGTWTRQ
jgi:hypothetical protein